MRTSALVLVPLALVAAACGSSGGSSGAPSASSSPASASGSSGAAAAVSTRSVGSLGTVLVDGHGRTLYVFTAEKGGKIVCTGSCASVWPAVMAASGQKPTASGGANASIVSTVADPSGGSIVTYGGWPLHTFASDSGPGRAGGQGMSSGGTPSGKWWVMSSSGSPITKQASTGGTTTTHYSGY